MTFAPPSVRRTLLTWLVIPLFTLTLISTIVIYRIALNFARDAYDHALSGSAEDIAELISQPGSGLDHSAPMALSNTQRELILEGKDEQSYYTIRDLKGRLLGGDRALPAPPAPTDNDYVDRVATFYDAVIDNQPVRVVVLPVAPKAGAGGAAILIQVAETLHRRQTLAREILTLLILPQLLLVFLSLAIVWYAVGRGLRPLAHLQSSILERSPRDLNSMRTTDVPTEIRPLVSAFNELLHRFNRVLNSQNLFIANAAHQFRTPLAGLKLHVALAARQNNLDEVRYSLGQLDLALDKLTHLVNQSLSLARNEPGADQSLELALLDLNALAQSVTEEWIGAAAKKEIDLGFETAGEPVWIRGEPVRLTELLNNLLDNALRYTPEHGTVTVRVDREYRLEVEDNGPGIPEAEREMIFERFYRSSEHRVDGSGLGLAIVKEIAEIHLAEVKVQPGENQQGSCFQIIFPGPC